MFEIGVIYEVTVQETGPETGVTVYYNCRVVQITDNLVKFDRGGSEWIVNVASPLFVSAKPRD